MGFYLKQNKWKNDSRFSMNHEFPALTRRKKRRSFSISVESFMGCQCTPVFTLQVRPI